MESADGRELDYHDPLHRYLLLRAEATDRRHRLGRTERLGGGRHAGGHALSEGVRLLAGRRDRRRLRYSYRDDALPRYRGAVRARHTLRSAAATPANDRVTVGALVSLRRATAR